MFRRHWMVCLAAGLLNLGLVLWALPGAALAWTPAQAGQLQSLTYEYGSFFGGYMAFTLEREQDGRLWLRAEPGNGLTLSVHAPVGDGVLEDLSALMAGAGIFAWDGFHGENMEVLDGFSFALEAVFDGGTLQAGGYEQYPEDFDRGHAALGGYLWNLAVGLLPTSLRPEDIAGAVLSYAGEDLRLDIARDSAAYYHGMIYDSHSGAELPPALMEAFFADAADIYNAGAESGVTGHPFALAVRVATAEDVETTLSLRGDGSGQAGAAPIPLERTALALVGRPAGFIGSEAYAMETYRNAFVYPGLLVWDPAGLGEVRIDLPGLTVTVNGTVHAVSREAMQRFSDAMDSQRLRLPFLSRDNEIEKTGDPIASAMDWWAALPKDGYGWLLAQTHVNGYTLFTYGGEALPPAWAETVRGPVEALLGTLSPSSPSAPF